MTWVDSWPYALLVIQVVLGICILALLVKVRNYILVFLECLVLIPILVSQSNMDAKYENGDNSASRYLCHHDALCLYASFAWIVQAWIVVAYQIYRFTLASDGKRNFYVSLVIAIPYTACFMYVTIQGWFPIYSVLVLVVPCLAYALFGVYVVANSLKRYASSNPAVLREISIPKLCFAAILWVFAQNLEIYSDLTMNELLHRIATVLLFTSELMTTASREEIRYQTLDDSSIDLVELPITTNTDESLSAIQISTSVHDSLTAYCSKTQDNGNNKAQKNGKSKSRLSKRLKNRPMDTIDRINADESMSGSRFVKPHERINALVMGGETDTDDSDADTDMDVNTELETSSLHVNVEPEMFDFTEMDMEMYRNRMYPLWYNELAFTKTLSELGFCRGNISAAMCNLYIVEVVESRIVYMITKGKPTNAPKWCSPGFRRAIDDFCNADKIQDVAASESVLRREFESLEYRDIMKMETNVRLYLRTRFESSTITPYIKFGSILEAALLEAEMYATLPAVSSQDTKYNQVFEFAMRRLFPEIVRYGTSQIASKYHIEIGQLEPMMKQMQIRSNLWSPSTSADLKSTDGQLHSERKENKTNIASPMIRIGPTVDKQVLESSHRQSNALISRQNGLVDVQLDYKGVPL